MTGPRLGAHMSIAGGMVKAVERALAVDSTALQVFVKSSNQWAAKPLTPAEVDAYRGAAMGAGLDRYTLAHASYLVNLASPADELWHKSVESFAGELERCETLGIPWLVVHPGSHVGSGVEAGIARIAKALTTILGGRKKGAQSGVLLEITAGQGNTLGSRFEELAEMLRLAKHDAHLGICFDTCHALAAGYEFRQPASYAKLMQEIDRTVGLERIKGFHLNDSKGDLGSRLDRHEHIGKGRLGLEAFASLLNDKRFRDVPMVLETPKDDDLAEDRVNLKTLRSLVRS